MKLFIVPFASCLFFLGCLSKHFEPFIANQTKVEGQVIFFSDTASFLHLFFRPDSDVTFLKNLNVNVTIEKKKLTLKYDDELNLEMPFDIYRPKKQYFIVYFRPINSNYSTLPPHRKYRIEYININEENFIINMFNLTDEKNNEKTSLIQNFYLIIKRK